MKKVLNIILPLLLIAGCSEQNGATGKLATFDHTYSEYARLLDENVADGRVNYAALKADRALLDAIVDGIGYADLSKATPEEKLAFYINSYNVITIRIIVDAYPVKSIRDIGGVLGKIRGGVWKRMKWTVAGREMTLDRIEHRIIRKKFSEPRVHFALVCASKSCAPLQPVPFYPDTIETQLAEAARDFVTNPSYNRLDPEAGRAEISSIFDWFGKDFIAKYYDGKRFPELSKKENAVLNFIVEQFPEKEKLTDKTYKISYIEYDWSLNDMK